MMCFRDRTYCQGPCGTIECSRQITDEVMNAARRAGLPLAISDMRDGCREYRAPGVSSPDAAKAGRE